MRENGQLQDMEDPEAVALAAAIDANFSASIIKLKQLVPLLQVVVEQLSVRCLKMSPEASYQPL